MEGDVKAAAEAEKPTPDPRLVMAAAAMTGILVGAAMVATRFAVDQVGPAGLAFLRYAIGAVLLAPLVGTAAKIRIARGDLLPVALLGIGQFGILIALLNYGLTIVPSGRAALIFSLFPLLTLTLGAALGRERMTAAKTGGVMLSILGVALVLGERVLADGPTGEREWLGAAAVLASAAVGAVCSLFYAPYVRKYDALPVSFVAMLAAVVFLALLAWPEGFYPRIPAIDVQAWLAITFIGLASALGYYLWLWSLARTTATRVTVFMALSPLTAAILGAAFLGEAMTLGMLAALGCIAGGLWLAHR